MEKNKEFNPLPITTQIVPANGLNFEVQTCGSGDPLALLLHGFPENAFSWRYQLPLLARLEYSAWAPNMRGYGKTSRPRNKNAYAMPHLLADVHGLLEASGREKALLVGHDWGGFIAWMFALSYPHLVNRLIILNMPHPALFFQRWFRWPQLARSWYIWAFQIPWLPEFVLGRNHAYLVGETFSRLAVDKSKFPEQVLEVYRDQATVPGALTAMLNYYRANMRMRLTTQQRHFLKRKLNIPTLILWGEKDAALGIELTFGTENLVSPLTVRYLPWVSHWIQQEAPEIVNELIEFWLGSN